ncbi:Phage terminase large subunit [Chryseobacterium oranimense G311]|uniref:phage terminase large subunit n=1 Tax=Chryseobacterium oranimense TaxID=421058 RepID=UPI0005338728|nr:phage terminase large subunit [Chryseobacterium oranimense]CEJ71269.1 Phage terminase large subunit [Chryseobacterium oranimense G311]DAG72822.1 MAG TPA: terminase large subunit [Caudoviricetes sp.]
MNSNLKKKSKSKYGVTEVFVKHDYYASLRIRLFDSEGRIFIDDGDRALLTDEILKVPTKRYDANKILPYETDLYYAYCKDEDYGSFPRYKYIFHEGSSRSSKSYSLEEWSLRECEQRPNLHINIWRDTREALTDSVWKDFRKLIPLSGRKKKLNKNTSPIHFNNGSIISPKGTDTTNAHGTTQDIAWLNEPYNVTEDEFDAIDQRSNQVVVDVNPLGIRWAEKVKKNPRCKVIYSTFKQNPFCPPDQKRKILGYEPWEPGTYEVINGVVMYNGKPVTETNQPPVHKANAAKESISVYKWITYGLGLKAENPRKIHHNFKPITLAEYLKIPGREYQGLDYGSARPSALVKMKFDGDRTFYIRPCLYKPMNNMSRPLGEELIASGAIVGGDTYMWADSADKEAGSNISMTNDLRTLYNINAVSTSKPTYKARFESMSNARFYFVYDLPADSSGVSLSALFEFELDNYQWEYINDKSTEKPIKKNDHFMNASEYVFWGIKEYLGLAF